ncbi:MAG TPA: UbiA family prenyltransferase, partial [Alphaproteobacteria bacterium]|nr:UbiA family prenyltransferase [Alphaproteobacteria bacterium]
MPGILLAQFFFDLSAEEILSLSVLLGFISICLIASSNYVLNEILDAKTDLFHPDKQTRPIPAGQISIPIAYIEYFILAIVGFVLGFMVNIPLGSSLVLFWIMGGLYNIPPIRLKDKPYFDVLCESINNP